MLVRLILKKINVLNILEVESGGLICVSANPVTLFIVLWSLTKLYACLKGDLMCKNCESIV